MGSSERLFNRQRTLHEMLGASLDALCIRCAGFISKRPRCNSGRDENDLSPTRDVADVILWRQKNVTLVILLVTLSVWLVFEKSGYTLLSLASSVLLLLMTTLFLWAKSAAVLNRPAPPLPELHLSEEMANEMASSIRIRLNALLSGFQNISLGKDSRLFFKVATSLLVIYFVGGLTDFLTLSYTSLVIVLTIPALYERCEDYVDKYVMMGYRKLLQLYIKLDYEYVNRFQNEDLEKKKLS